MASNKIVRSLCYFSEEAEAGVFEELKRVQQRVEGYGYTVQTRRACFAQASMAEAGAFCNDAMTFVSVGTLRREAVQAQLDEFIRFANLSFNLDLTAGVEVADGVESQNVGVFQIYSLTCAKETWKSEDHLVRTDLIK